MKNTELVAALRNLKATFKPMVCLDCQKGDNCTINGCNLIGLAADTIEKYESAIESIEKMYKIYMPPIPDPRANIAQKQSKVNLNIHCEPIANATPLCQTRKRVTDFERCADTEELANSLRCINDNGYYMIGVTQDGAGTYTVFFRRPSQD